MNRPDFCSGGFLLVHFVVGLGGFVCLGFCLGFFLVVVVILFGWGFWRVFLVCWLGFFWHFCESTTKKGRLEATKVKPCFTVYLRQPSPSSMQRCPSAQRPAARATPSAHAQQRPVGHTHNSDLWGRGTAGPGATGSAEPSRGQMDSQPQTDSLRHPASPAALGN